MDELPVVDLTDLAFWSNPYPVLAEALGQHPLGRGVDGGLIALSFDAAEMVLRDPRFLTTDLLAPRGITEGPIAEWWGQVMFSANPPVHTRLRRLVSRAFTPRAVESLRPRVVEITEELLDGFRDDTVDLVAGFAHELPIRVMGAMLEVPAGDHRHFAAWTADLGLVFSSVHTPELLNRLESAITGLNGYVAELIADRRRQPGDDLLSKLIAAEADGDALTEPELIAMVENLLFAGHDTTRSMLMIGAALLLSHPEQRALLSGNPDLAAQAVDEILRFEAPVLGSGRDATESLDLFGVPVAAGETVTTMSLAANRDPAAFDNPDRFDIRRPGGKLMSFGQGIHYCLGAALARLEGQVAFPMLLERYPRIELAAEPVWVPYASIRRFEELLVTTS
ncbi:MAG: cytochrome P450 [Acidimicrobiia bacterium]|nr:cytochrome P450 [Acidimicrobiia bacterium]MYE74382.1 cytochrome P450 [Acidimicrobiia bacterium]MYJ62082.1 cytochrome P450 [Acidimicrobiia bacterium]